MISNVMLISGTDLCHHFVILNYYNTRTENRPVMSSVTNGVRQSDEASLASVLAIF